MKKEKTNEQVNKRKGWFEFIKKIMKVRYKKPTFIYLGEEVSTGGIILSNHEGTDSPMSLEIYLNKPIRFWGTHEMNSGLKKMYKYQSEVYYHQKKHWCLFGAKLFCLLASPLTNLFYKGLNLISTYRDGRFTKTIKESITSIQNGNNIVIFPEKSENGYQDTLDGFYNGFVMLAEVCKKRGIDLPIFVSYYNKKRKLYIFDKPVLYSEISKNNKTKSQISEELCNRCNELGNLSKTYELPNTTPQKENKKDSK